MISRALQCKGTSRRIPKFNWDLHVSNLNLKHTVPVTRAGPIGLMRARGLEIGGVCKVALYIDIFWLKVSPY